MKTLVSISLIGLFLQQLCLAQTPHQTISLDIMTAAVSQSSMDSVPVKISVPHHIHLSEITFQISGESHGELFITGTPYDSIQVQLPSDSPINNQYGEQAELKDFQLRYGAGKDKSAMEVVSPAGCVALQIPESGRIDIALGSTLMSADNLRGIYTGSVRLDCNPEE